MANFDINDELSFIQVQHSQAAKLRVQAARERAQADEILRQELEKLDQLVKHYDSGLVVCPKIKQIMKSYPLLKECYPNEFYQQLWNKCGLS